ncbi:MAG: hypothetical protein IJB29_04810 [Mailhella sp.]|nr:hypothetical protein [Mailhella sp.]
MSWANVGWWLLYAFAAISLQAVLPGVDFLFPGFILALQERRIFQTLFLGCVFMLAQEGMGSMAFGGTLLWYAVTALAYYVACSLFQGGSFLFIFLLAVILSGAHYVIFGVLASLQGIPWEPALLLDECFFQAVLTPCIWLAASSLRRGVRHEAGE